MARKILLADDSVTAQNMGRKILADAGYEVITVNNGSAALKKMAEVRPDLVILDEVQRFRDVLDEANNSEHIAAELFAKRVPVLILSATPYRALTLGHEVAEGDQVDEKREVPGAVGEDFLEQDGAERQDQIPDKKGNRTIGVLG